MPPERRLTEAQVRALKAIAEQNVIWDGTSCTALRGRKDVAERVMEMGLAVPDHVPVRVRYLVLSPAGHSALQAHEREGKR